MIFHSVCLFWVYKKWFDIPARLVEDPDSWCWRHLGNAPAIDGKPCVEVQLADGKLDVVDNFVYLGDCICPGGGCELASIKRYCSALGKFREPLPLLTCKAISLYTCGQMYSSCIRRKMLHSSEFWTLRQEDKKHLEHSERAMLSWILTSRKKSMSPLIPS